MPYTMDNLPAVAKKLPKDKQAQWMEVFNSVIKSGKPESAAFAIANGVANKKDYYDVAVNRMTQYESNYKVLGGTETKACAACRWFVSPDNCTVVSGDINPGGICDYYMAEQDIVQEPIPVVVMPTAQTNELKIWEKAVWSTAFQNNLPDSSFAWVESGGTKDSEGKTVPRSLRHLVYKDASGKVDAAHVRDALARFSQTTGVPTSVRSKLESAARSVGIKVGGKSIFDIFRSKNKDVDSEEVTFFFVKTIEDDVRFFVLASNNFKDRQRETITESAHKEFVNWCDSEGQYPELWLWHSKGSKIGEVDWIDSSDGMLVASGLIDEKSVDLAERLGNNLGVSHGFLGVTTAQGHITNYRSYEISLLPRSMAANTYTGVNFLKELNMPFSEAKRKWLSEKVGDEAIVSDWERQTDELSMQLKAAGVEFKDIDIDEKTTDMQAIRAELANTNKTIGDLAAVVAASQKSVAQAVDEAFEAKVKVVDPAKVYVASEKSDNEPATKIDVKKDSWFDDLVMGGIGK